MNESKGFYNERSGLIIMLVGLVIFILAFLIMNPLGTGMGVSESPQRIVLLYIFAFVFCLPFGAYWMYKFARRPDWLAMAGRYIQGMKVAVFSPYSLVAIGIVGALFAAAGLGDLGGIDLQAMIIAASASLFGGIVSFFGLFVGQIIARVLINPVWVGGVSAGALSLLPYTLIDASIWAYFGWVYFRFVHDRGDKPFWRQFFIAWILGEPVHQIWWMMTYWIMNTREAAILAVLNDWVIPGAGTFFGIPYWWLSGIVFVPVGLLAGEAARRAMTSGRGQTKA
ncbi:MAG: hypothetical protein ANABAC_2075 [Anaerolineae bacterium]|jgi:hypothetical protein|nr:MAG: hypothetical protein ANABAC_2075 [Anaerolineae bacterium]